MKRLLCFALSWSLTFAPLTILPAPVHAQTNGAEEESALSRATNLIIDIERLIDRAYYPNVPQLARFGLPNRSELQAIEARLGELHRGISQTFPARLTAIRDPDKELFALGEIKAFYDAVTRYEGLNVYLGQPLLPEEWDTRYSIQIPLDHLDQLKFFETASLTALASNGDTESGLTLNFPMRTRLEDQNGRQLLKFEVNPDFIERAERQRFLTQINTKNTVLFATHFAAHRLYEAAYITNELSREADHMPEPELSWKLRFPSFKVKRDLMNRVSLNQQLKEQKAILEEAVKNGLKELEGAGSGFVLNEDFWRRYYQMTGGQMEGINLEGIRKDEAQAFLAALNGVLRLWDIRDPARELHRHLYFAKRLSLRWLIFVGPMHDLTSNYRAQLEQILDEAAKNFADELTKLPSLQAAVSRAASVTRAEMRKKQRLDFHNHLRHEARELKDFATKEIRLQTLLAAKQPEIEALAPSAMAQNVLAQIGQAQTYQDGYSTYKSALLTILEAYELPKMNGLDIDELISIKGEIRFAPTKLNGIIAQEYLQALSQNADIRKKDVSDLLSIGEILKFNVYEKLSEEQKKSPTAEQLGLRDRWFSNFIGSELRTYQDALKNDLFAGAPILGFEVSGQPLWQVLAEQPETGDISALVDPQITAAARQAEKNLIRLDQYVRKIENSRNPVDGMDEELKTIIGRTSQLALVLSSFSSAKGYYEKIRQELLLPGFWENEWRQFYNWSGNAMLILATFYLAQIFGMRFMPVAKAADMVSKTLSPIFGINLSRLTPLIWGSIFIGVGEPAYRGFVTDAKRVETLRNYFSCNASGPCVALHSDVTRQTQIRNYARFQAVSQVALLAVIFGGFHMLNRVVGERLQGLGQRELSRLREDLRTLNLREGASMGEQSLGEAYRESLRIARSQKDPRVAELVTHYARQSYFRIERMVWKEARKWAKFDARFQEAYKKLGLTPSSAKNPDLLADTLGRLEAQYANGQIATYEYLELKNSIFNMYQSLSPIWTKMDKSPLLKSFYERVWHSTGQTSQYQVNLNFKHFDDQLRHWFLKEMDKFYGTTTTGNKIAALTRRIMQDIEKHPELAANRIEQLRRMLVKEVTP